ncbi:MAG: D-aminoacyl-tRNA deacylase [Bacilli bacterium]|jgi:D-tyrosyl-tRNA(Tyr) deacylase|nr:D-aminoacyl-tRNA deacylase [Bacilli bacterium]HHU24837.1 D-tyrosyl-tRNA(Tyr) deacylase [Acholeplasmataceae bacterium]
MKVVVQRVKKASCIVDGHVVSQIGKGYLLLVGFTHGDTIEEAKKMAKKISNLRIFEDENQKMNLSIQTIKGEILSISQFTLYADTEKGNRPSFVDSMNPDEASKLYEEFNQILESEYHIPVKAGVFGAHMELAIVCDGPVTISLSF